MVVPVLASAVAPTVVASATDKDGLVNQAFKITVLIGLALAIGTGIFLIYSLTSILSGLGDVAIIGTIGRILGGSVGGPLGGLLTGVTYLSSAFGFGGRGE